MTGSRRRLPISWTRRAQRDLRGIGDFIARDKPDAAARWVGRILEAVGRRSLFPGSGRIVPEVGRDDVREVVLRNYRIVYQVREGGIAVLTVFEGHQLLDMTAAVDEDLE